MAWQMTLLKPRDKVKKLLMNQGIVNKTGMQTSFNPWWDPPDDPSAIADLLYLNLHNMISTFHKPQLKFAQEFFVFVHMLGKKSENNLLLTIALCSCVNQRVHLF